MIDFRPVTCRTRTHRSIRLRGLVGFLLVGLAGGAWAADERPKARSAADLDTSPGDIVVQEVRLKLKEKRLLAGERSGVISEVRVRQGDVVQAGDLVVQLNDSVARATHATAQKRASSDIEIRYAQAANDVANADLEKAKEANRRRANTVPAVEVRKLELSLRRTELQIEQAEHQFAVSLLEAEEASEQLKTYQVHAPIGGRIAKVHKQAGEAVAQGEVIVELVNTDKLLADGYVSLEAAQRVKRGSPVTFHHAGQKYAGEIIDVDQQATLVGGFRVKVFAEITTTPVEADAAEDLPGILAGLESKMVIHRPAAAPAEQDADEKAQPNAGGA